MRHSKRGNNTFSIDAMSQISITKPAIEINMFETFYTILTLNMKLIVDNINNIVNIILIF